MPEGNEIHRWAERHAAAFAGKPVRMDGPQGRFTDWDLLDGRKLRRVMAVGKHLGYDFGKDRILHVHLGLQGDFTEGSGALPAVKGALRMRMWNAAAVKKPMVPGLSKRHSWYSSDDGTGHLQSEQIAWVERIAKSKKPIGILMMEQDVMAGVGNIFRAEVLFRARQSPFTPGREVPGKVVKAMWKELGPLMRAGMVDRRIVTTMAKDRVSKKGPVQVGDEHYVYRRNGQPCRVCGTKVMKREGFAGRNLFWCPVCQAEG